MKNSVRTALILVVSLFAAGPLAAEDWSSRDGSLRAAFEKKDVAYIKRELADSSFVKHLKIDGADFVNVLLIAVWSRDISLVKLLLDAGFDPDIECGPNAMPPLIQAVEYGETEMVKLLLASGADANILGRGKTPLVAAIEIKSTVIAGLLLQFKASVNVFVYDGKGGLFTPLDLAEDMSGKNSGLAQMLLQAGAGSSMIEIHGPYVDFRGQCTEDRVRLRTAPSLSGDVRGYLMKDETAGILRMTGSRMSVGDSNSHWFEVNVYQEGIMITGWVYGAFLKVQASPGMMD